MTPEILDEIMGTEQDETGYVPVGLSIESVDELPKRKTNLKGREGIKWEEVLAPVTNNAGQWYAIFKYPYKDEAEQKRRQNLCASKSASIRKRLTEKVPEEDWDVATRTDEKNSTVGVYVRYHGEFTPERAKLRDERNARVAKAAATRAANAAGE